MHASIPGVSGLLSDRASPPSLSLSHTHTHTLYLSTRHTHPDCLAYNCYLVELAFAQDEPQVLAEDLHGLEPSAHRQALDKASVDLWVRVCVCVCVCALGCVMEVEVVSQKRGEEDEWAAHFAVCHACVHA